MLDWEAPTGGYLLQASFATGVAAGRGALEWTQGREKSSGGVSVLPLPWGMECRCGGLFVVIVAHGEGTG